MYLTNPFSGIGSSEIKLAVEKVGNAILDGVGYLKTYVELLSEDKIEYSSLTVASGEISKTFNKSLAILDSSNHGLANEIRQEHLNQVPLRTTLNEIRNSTRKFKELLRQSSTKLSTFKGTFEK